MKVRLLCLAALGLATSLPAAAQFAKPEDAIKYRQGGMAVMGAHFGRLGAMAQGKVPFDAKAAADNAEVVAFVSRLPFAGFVEGTDKGNTKAKPEIWKEPDKFKANASRMQEEVAKLNVAAKSGNPDQVKAAFGEAAKTCKSCHDDFREK
ncbi:cytochrome c [Piscinibacter sp. XHJ-5]|uniref:c-type cytochrome n=1 Tax=Piscinibacter sp. XHJ-5 TaxID=3037797 RepID=UPI0024533E17|nr:cytochrome c [Piscinibacter sp. XHJ-5]